MDTWVVSAYGSEQALSLIGMECSGITLFRLTLINIAEDETSDSSGLRQHPRRISEEPGPQSSHLAVKILLQNHGFPFHPEGDSR